MHGISDRRKNNRQNRREQILLFVFPFLDYQLFNAIYYNQQNTNTTTKKNILLKLLNNYKI